MTISRPLILLRFAIEANDAPLAAALSRLLGPAGDRELREMARLRAGIRGPRVLTAALDVVARSCQIARHSSDQ